jgi:hypothetical protein
LISVLAHRFHYKFERYEIILCGAFSSIALRQSPLASGASGKAAKYELYLPGSEDRFGQGLIYLLDSVRLISDFIERQHSHLL